MYRIALLIGLGLATSACTRSAAPATPPSSHFDLAARSPADSTPPASETSSATGIVALCVETDGPPLTPVLYVHEGQCAEIDITVGERVDTLQVLVSGPEAAPRLAVTHTRDGQLLSSDEVSIDHGAPTRVGTAGPVAQLDLFSSEDEFRAWHDAGGAALGTASGCVSG